jgi:multicomponent K+:H+ antiporter subunit G
VLEIFISLFLLIGAAFALIGSIGLARLPDLFMRLHGPTKATTLGVGGILVASSLYFSNRGGGLSLHELLVTLFLFSTAPISAFLVARTMLHLRGEGAQRREKTDSCACSGRGIPGGPNTES